jgi:hypothetical protein
MNKQVSVSFAPQGIVVPVSNLLPLKQIKSSIRSTQKYLQVLASVREVGIIEPLIVFIQDAKSDTYLVLDGHVRLEVLKQLGETHARCLISTDDETYTYNKRINRLSTIQEHTMILKAIRSGVSEERIAKVLKVDISTIREKRDLLNGICKEAADLLKNSSHVSVGAFAFLKKVKPIRQIEMAELMAGAANYSVPYVKALVVATPPDMLVDPDKHKVTTGLSPEQIAKMEKEMQGLQRDLKIVEDSHGTQVLNLVLTRGYLIKLFGNSRITRYLGQHHGDIFQELQTVVEGTSLEN